MQVGNLVRNLLNKRIGIVTEVDSENNLDLGILQPDEFFLLAVSVCGYEAGELNTEGEDPARPVTGALRFATDGEPESASVDFSFIPIRLQD